MWETYGLDNEDFLWSCVPFMAGISGQQQAPCGVVSASSVSLGLRHRCSLSDKEKAKESRATIRHYAAELVKSFNAKLAEIDAQVRTLKSGGSLNRSRESTQSGEKKRNSPPNESKKEQKTQDEESNKAAESDEQQITDAEKRIEQIRAEILQAMDRLEQIESEG